MRTSIPNTGDSDGSPCRACPNHLAGINKELCLNECKRLATYRDGRDWREEEVFIVPNLIKDTEGLAGPEEMLQDKLHGAAIPTHTETNWKKAMPPKPETEKPIQNICAMDGCDRPAELRGCCRPCYQRWRSGLLGHPVMGAFRKMTTTETRQARLKKTNEESVVDKDIEQTRTVAGVGGISKTATVNQEETVAALTVKELDRIISIDFHQYGYLFSRIRREASRLSLPIPHIIMTMLGEAMAIKDIGGDGRDAK